jgi:5-methylcytosine-specific restriction endonuclease McrA
MKAKKSRLPTIKSLKKKADGLWSRIVKEKYNGRCAFCGETFAIAAHHIRSRRFSSTRWNTENGIALCRGCHLTADVDYEKFRRQFVDLHGEAILADLFILSQVLVKVNRVFINETIRNLEEETNG